MQSFPASKRQRPGARFALRRRSTLVLAGFISFVPILLFAAFWIRSEIGKSQRELEMLLSGQARMISEVVDSAIEPQLEALRLLSAVPDLVEAGPAFDRIATEIVRIQPQWDAFAILNPDGGEVMAASPPTFRQAGNPQLLRSLQQTRRPAVMATAGGGILLYVPLLRDGIVRLVVSAVLNPAGLRRTVDASPVGAGVGIVVTDSTGLIVAGRDGADAALASRLLQAAGMERDGLIDDGEAVGAPRAGAYVRSAVTGWTSFATVTRSQLERMSTRSVWTTIAAGLVSLLLAAALIAFTVYAALSRRVVDERLAASKALGELDARLLATTQEALGEQRKAASEREVLLREIYHRVKNNLQIVQSLLRLGSRELKPEQREPFEGAVRRIGAMARVHTLLYNSPDLASIDFKDYLEELIKELADGFAAEDRSIAAIVQAQSMRVPLDTAVPLAFIAVEILTNAFRHAFPNGQTGRIDVSIAHDEPFGTLTISDTGVGLAAPPGAKAKLGLTIVRKLVQQIGGSIQEPESGSSTYLIRFPLEQASGPVPVPSALPPGVLAGA